jgi:hypothetical protein
MLMKLHPATFRLLHNHDIAGCHAEITVDATLEFASGVAKNERT